MKKIIIILLLLRFVLFFVVSDKAGHIVLRGDAEGYDKCAQAFVEHGSFFCAPDNLNYQTNRTPLYPLFLAVCYFVFGVKVAPAIFLQILLSCFTVYLIYLLAEKLFDKEIALFSALLLAVDFASISFTQYLLTETLFTFFVVASVLTGVYVLKEGRFSFLFGVLLACASLTRPITYYIVFPVAVGFFIFRPKSLLVLLIPYVVLVGSWQFRNYLVSGNPAFSTIQGTNLYAYRAASVLAEKEGVLYDEAKDGLPKIPVNQMSREGMKIILDNPWVFLKTELKGLGQLMLIPGVDSFLSCFGISSYKQGCFGDLFRLSLKDFFIKWSKRPVWLLTFIFFLVYLYLMYLFFLRGLDFSKEHIFVLCVILYLIGLSAGVEANVRFRVPIMPLLLVFSANGICKFKSKK